MLFLFGINKFNNKYNFTGGKEMKHSVIRIVCNEAGQNCKVELTVNDKIDADYFADIMNRNYGGKNVSWIVDSYKIAE